MRNSPDLDTFLASTVSLLRSRGMQRPRTTIVLGSGLGSYAKQLKDPISVSTSEIPGYPLSTVQGHAGMIHYGRIRSGKFTSQPILVFQGRIHPYEGVSSSLHALNVRLAHSLGTKRLMITNAAGGIRRDLEPGSIMLHSGLMRLPTKTNESSIMHEIHELNQGNVGIYDRRLRNIIAEAGKEVGIEIKEGTYCYVLGPTYESVAEVRMMGILGADAVGMSTYPEVEQARGLGLPTVAISLISNKAAGLSEKPLAHADVTRIGRSSGSLLSRLVTASLIRMDKN